MEFSALLRLLPGPDLQILLRRRPEAVDALVRRTNPDFVTLASALSSSYGIEGACSRLSVGLYRVLALILLCDGTLEADEAEREGIDPEHFLNAGRELARFGLAFPKGSRLIAPTCVLASFSVIDGIGLRLPVLLNKLTNDELMRMSRKLGLGTLKGSKPALAQSLAAHLSNPDVARSLVADAPARATRILEVIRALGCVVEEQQLREAIGAETLYHSLRSWSRPDAPTDGIEWLTERGLICVFSRPGSYGPVYAITAEVERALRGRLFDSWPLEERPIPSKAAHPGRGPEEILSEMEALLSRWAVQPPRAVLKGGLGVRELKQSAKDLRMSVPMVTFLYALAAGAGLVGERRAPSLEEPVRARGRRSFVPSEVRVVVPTAEADMWAERSDEERWITLANAYRGSIVFSETRGGVVPVDELPYLTSLILLRETVLDALITLPEGEGATTDALISSLALARPAWFARPEAPTFIQRVGEALSWLGGGTTMDTKDGLIGLSPPGRAWLLGDHDTLANAFAPGIETFTVQSDLTIVVAGRPAAASASMLRVFADATDARPAWIFKLSPTSIRRALDAGHTAEHILKFLTERSTGGIPQTVAALINDTATAHGRLRVGRAEFVISTDDPSLIAQIASSRKLRGLSVRAITPTVAAVKGASVDTILRTLRAAGFSPVVDEESVRVDADEDTEDVIPLHPALVRHRADPQVAAVQIERLAAALAKSAKRPAGRSAEPKVSPVATGAPITAKTKIRELMREAARDGFVVEIVYTKSSADREQRRMIEPVATYTGSVWAFCRLRKDMRTFSFRRMTLARVTGDRFDPTVHEALLRVATDDDEAEIE